jgi:hypothetical protein
LYLPAHIVVLSDVNNDRSGVEVDFKGIGIVD